MLFVLKLRTVIISVYLSVCLFHSGKTELGKQLAKYLHKDVKKVHIYSILLD